LPEANNPWGISSESTENTPDFHRRVFLCPSETIAKIGGEYNDGPIKIKFILRRKEGLKFLALTM
jgi:hypothetical protein